MSKEITAAMVKELRDRTGGGMMECKKALVEANGDFEIAIDNMRKSGAAKAAKKSGRTAAEGRVVVKISTDGKSAVILEVNCETDFVSRDASFIQFTEKVAEFALENKINTVDDLLAFSCTGGCSCNAKTVAQCLEGLVAKLGENIRIRRVAFMHSANLIGSYVHSDKIGVLVNLSVDNKDLGKDIAMHIAASKPTAVSAKDLPQEMLDKEREIYLAQVESSGKPAEILSKMVEGKLQKFIKEITLLDQSFIKNPDITVDALLKTAKATVLSFVRFEVGEGIEKETIDFATEVQNQINKK